MRKIIDKMLPICFILPYLEVDYIRKLFAIRTDNAELPASIFLMCFSALIFLCATPKGSIYAVLPKQFLRFIHAKAFVDIYFVCRTVFAMITTSYSITTLIFQIIYYIIPFWYALIIVRYIVMRKIKVKKVARNGGILFVVYLIACVAINLKTYGFGFNGSRIVSTGGGSVILGYTIALMMAFIFQYRPYNKTVELIFVGICFGAALLTGTRGGIWPTAALFLLFIIIKREGSIDVPIFLIIVIAITFLDPLHYLSNIMPRILDFTESGRLSTISAGFKVFVNQPIYEMLLGTGLGNLFPYQQWLINYSMRGTYFLDYNGFYYNGIRLFVQPHNTYIYILLETGVIGLVLFVVMLRKIWKAMKASTLRQHISSMLLFFLFILMGMVETTIFVQSGSSGLWWLLLILSCVPQQCGDEEGEHACMCYNIKQRTESPYFGH